MAKRYIETKEIQGLTKKEVVEKLSATLWNFQRPDAVKNPRDVTKYLFGIQPHPVIEDDYVVEVDDSFSIRKHPQAIASEILDLADGLSQSDKTTLTDYIKNNAEPVVGEILNNLRDEIVQYKLWDDLPIGHPIDTGDKFAIIQQSIEDSTLVFYNCIQSHQKQLNWSPETVPALFDEITIVGDIEVWVQPIGGDGKYVEGATVTHNGRTWRNDHTGGLNVWEPSVFGWTDIGPA